MLRSFFHSIDRNMKVFIVLISIIFVANSAMNTIITVAVTTSTEIQIENKLNNQTVTDLKQTVTVLRDLLNTSLSINKVNQQMLINGTDIANDVEDEIIENQGIMNQTVSILQKIEDKIDMVIVTPISTNKTVLLYQNLSTQ